MGEEDSDEDEQAPHLPRLGIRPRSQHLSQSRRAASLCGQPPAWPPHPHRYLPPPSTCWCRVHPWWRPCHCHRTACWPSPVGTRHQRCLCLQRGSHGHSHHHHLPHLAASEHGPPGEEGHFGL